jgi:transcriptional regulator with XRE-family HTH domain
MPSRKIDRAPTVSAEDREARARKLGTLIREARGDRTQEQLAEGLGVSLSTLRKVEQGQIRTPGFWLVAEIAASLGLRLDELLAGERIPLPEPRRVSPPAVSVPRPELAHRTPHTPKSPPHAVWVSLVGGKVRVRPGDRVRLEGLVREQRATIHVEPLERFEVERRKDEPHQDEASGDLPAR